jgi:hypothetical protein
MDPAPKTKVIKGTVASTFEEQEHITKLKKLATTVHHLTKTTYSFLKYIFITELSVDINFDVNSLVNVGFFTEMYSSLVLNYKPDKTKLKDQTLIYRTIINRHRGSFCKDAGYDPVSLNRVHQIPKYELMKIKTAYTNNISSTFGNRLSMMLNILLKK